MVEPRFLEQVVTDVIADAQVHPTDLNGGGDHWFVVVVSAGFAEKRSFERQRPILQAFTPHIQAGRIHALDLKCITPDELREWGMPKPFRPHGPGEGMHPGAWS